MHGRGPLALPASADLGGSGPQREGRLLRAGVLPRPRGHPRCGGPRPPHPPAPPTRPRQVLRGPPGRPRESSRRQPAGRPLQRLGDIPAGKAAAAPEPGPGPARPHNFTRRMLPSVFTTRELSPVAIETPHFHATQPSRRKTSQLQGLGSMVCAPLQVRCRLLQVGGLAQTRGSGGQVSRSRGTEAAPLPPRPAHRAPRGRAPPTARSGAGLRPAGATPASARGPRPHPSTLRPGPAACVCKLGLPGPETRPEGFLGGGCLVTNHVRGGRTSDLCPPASCQVPTVLFSLPPLSAAPGGPVHPQGTTKGVFEGDSQPGRRKRPCGQHPSRRRAEGLVASWRPRSCGCGSDAANHRGRPPTLGAHGLRAHGTAAGAKRSTSTCRGWGPGNSHTWRADTERHSCS